MDSSKVKEDVREHYAEIARHALKGERSSCCAPSDVIPADLIGTRDTLPQQVIETFLGCGSPVKVALLQPGEAVLDLGSGGGLDCLYASRLVGPAGRVIGVDMTPEMIALAKTNAGRIGALNVEFRQGELEKLPVDNASVDVVVSNCVVNLAPDKDRVFQEAFRVLRPGGRIAISDVVSGQPLPDSIRQDTSAWASCVSGAIPEQDYVAKIQAAGFADVRVLRRSGLQDMVYSADVVAVKPGGDKPQPKGWGEAVPAAASGSCCG